MTTLDTGKVASELGTDARMLRKFLRSDASPLQPVGQGARYAITAEDIPELKAKFDAWKQGKRPAGQSSRKPASDRPRRAQAVEKMDPLEADSLMTRLGSSIGDRQRAHGVVCNHTWPHPKVKGMAVKCTAPTVKSTKFCKHHQQITWCGSDEPLPALCGPSPELQNSPTGHPFCKYHNGDISEKEFNQILLDNPNGDPVE